MKKTPKLASMVLAASFLAGTASPANRDLSFPEINRLEKLITECNAINQQGLQQDNRRDYSYEEISQIIHDIYRCTPKKPDYFSEKFVREIITQESKYNPKAVSPKGARGLMQIKSIAWREVEKERNYREHVFDPRANTRTGIRYLLGIDRQFEENYNGWEKLTPKEKREMVLSAYNAGISRFKEKKWQLRDMPRETRNYVGTIISRLELLED